MAETVVIEAAPILGGPDWSVSIGNTRGYVHLIRTFNRRHKAVDLAEQLDMPESRAAFIRELGGPADRIAGEPGARFRIIAVQLYEGRWTVALVTRQGHELMHKPGTMRRDRAIELARTLATAPVDLRIFGLTPVS